MDKKTTTEAQKRAKQKYMEKYVEVKVRMTHDKREIIKAHAIEHDKGSTTAFINRAIDFTMEYDNAQSQQEQTALQESLKEKDPAPESAQDTHNEEQPDEATIKRNKIVEEMKAQRLKEGESFQIID